MKTSELTGAQLDYWVARAEGVPAEQLTIEPVQRTADYKVVRRYHIGFEVMRYSRDWVQGGPLIEKYKIDLDHTHKGPVEACIREWVGSWRYVAGDEGDTPLRAICRAVVRAAFGDEVEEVAVCE